MRKKCLLKRYGGVLAIVFAQLVGATSEQKASSLNAHRTHSLTVMEGKATGSVAEGMREKGYEEELPIVADPAGSVLEDTCDHHVKARVVGIVPAPGLVGAYEILVEWSSVGLPNCFKLKRVDFKLRLANGQTTETSIELFGVFENPAHIRLRNLGSKPLKAEAVVYIGGPATGSDTKEGGFE